MLIKAQHHQVSGIKYSNCSNTDSAAL